MSCFNYIDFECELVKELEEQRLPEEWVEKPVEVEPIRITPHLQVYCNGLMQVENVDYTVKINANGNPFLTFQKPITANNDVQITYKVAQNITTNVRIPAAMAEGFNLNDFVLKQ